MNRLFYTLAVLATVVLMATAANAQGFGPGNGDGVCNFIDEDGDGFNDLAPDADGDGIPNGLDPDFVRPEDGAGHQWGADNDGGLFAKSFGVDDMGNMNRFGHAHGPGDGMGNGAGPGEGTGFGPGSGTGNTNGDGAATNENVHGRRGRH